MNQKSPEDTHQHRRVFCLDELVRSPDLQTQKNKRLDDPSTAVIEAKLVYDCVISQE